MRGDPSCRLTEESEGGKLAAGVPGLPPSPLVWEMKIFLCAIEVLHEGGP